jgi:hypothetical protein
VEIDCNQLRASANKLCGVALCGGSFCRPSFNPVVIGGLVFSQLLPAYLTPIFFVSMEQFMAWGAKRKHQAAA